VKHRYSHTLVAASQWLLSRAARTRTAAHTSLGIKVNISINIINITTQFELAATLPPRTPTHRAAPLTQTENATITT